MKKATLRYSEPGMKVVSRTTTGARIDTDEDGEYTLVSAFETEKGPLKDQWKVLTGRVIDIHVETVEDPK